MYHSGLVDVRGVEEGSLFQREDEPRGCHGGASGVPRGCLELPPPSRARYPLVREHAAAARTDVSRQERNEHDRTIEFCPEGRAFARGLGFKPALARIRLLEIQFSCQRPICFFFFFDFLLFFSSSTTTPPTLFLFQRGALESRQTGRWSGGGGSFEQTRVSTLLRGMEALIIVDSYVDNDISITMPDIAERNERDKT